MMTAASVEMSALSAFLAMMGSAHQHSYSYSSIVNSSD